MMLARLRHRATTVRSSLSCRAASTPAGDFDGDGLDDLVFPYSRERADSFIAYGRRAVKPVTLRGRQASFIVGSIGWDELAAPVGDVNGDGLADVLVALKPNRSAAVVRPPTASGHRPA